MSIERTTRSSETKVDTQLNYTHIALLVSSIFAIGVAYGTTNAKLDKLLLAMNRIEVLETRATKLEEINQSQVFINKNVEDHFQRTDQNIKDLQEQRPKNN